MAGDLKERFGFFKANIVGFKCRNSLVLVPTQVGVGGFVQEAQMVLPLRDALPLLEGTASIVLEVDVRGVVGRCHYLLGTMEAEVVRFVDFDPFSTASGWKETGHCALYGGEEV